MKRFLTISILYLVASLASYSQTRSAGGVVTDLTTAKSLEYISVYFKNTASGCITNYKGEFFVKDSSGADTLVVDAIGYEKIYIKLKAGQNTGMKIQMKPANIRLTEAVVRPKKERYRKKDNPAIEYTAKAFATLTYFKLVDDIMDEKLIKKIAVSTLRPVFSHAKRRSGLRELAEVMASKLAEITRLANETAAVIKERLS